MNTDDDEAYSLLNHEGRRLANSTSAMELVRASRWPVTSTREDDQDEGCDYQQESEGNP